MSRTIPFSRMLFEKERAALEPLDTPEKEAGLVARLRQAAATIADPDLARSYKEYLVGAFYQLTRPSETQRRDAGRVLYRDRRARRAEAVLGATPEGRASAARVSAMPRPLVAAVVEGLIAHPGVIHDRAELLAIHGMGDRDLDRLIGDLIHLSHDMEALGTGLLRARLVALGHGELLDRLNRPASLSHAPFLSAGAPLDRAQIDIIKAIDVLLESFALNRAIDDLKTESTFDSAAFAQLKSRRDALAALMSSGGLWGDAAETRH